MANQSHFAFPHQTDFAAITGSKQKTPLRESGASEQQGCGFDAALQLNTESQMSQQGGVGAFIMRRPKLPLSGARAARQERRSRAEVAPINHRLRGEEIADAFQGAIVAASRETGNYPQPDLFERINPERKRPPSCAAVFEGLSWLSSMPELRMPTWNRVLATLNCGCETLVSFPAGCFMTTWREDTVTDSVADVLKQQMVDAMASGDIAAMNECQVAIRTNMFHGQRMIDAIEACKQQTLSGRMPAGARS